MRTSINYIILIITTLHLLSCSNHEFNNQIFFIRGKIQHYESDTNQKTITFHFQTLENNKEDIKISYIDSIGNFRAETSIAWPQDFYFEYADQRFYFICSPGDSIKFEIDNAICNGENNDFFKYLTVTGGSSFKDNEFVNLFMHLTENFYSKIGSSENVKKYKPQDYKKFVLSQNKNALEALAGIKDSLKTTALFDKWAKSYINYYTYVFLLRYHWFHPILNGIDYHDFKMPENYYSFLKEIDRDDFNVISTPQADYYAQYSMYIDELLPGDSLELNKKEYYQNLIEKSIKYSSGFTMDVMLFDIYSRMLDESLISELEAIYQPVIFNNKYFEQKINNKIAGIKNQNKEFDKSVTFLKNNEGIIDELIDTITNKYHNKVIYMDFWSTSCGPCLQEMPYTKALIKEYQNKDVIFLYLASACKEDIWKAKINEMQLCGEHILLSKDQFRVLSQKFEITGIPHYVLIDKQGKIILKNAARPGSNDIRNEIDKLL